MKKTNNRSGLYQVRNSRTGRYVVIDPVKHKIVHCLEKPKEGIPIKKSKKK